MSFNPNDYLISLKGKQYLQVAHRLMWFRATHPSGSIITETISLEPIVFKATVLDGENNILGTGHGSANAKPGAVWSGREIEKAETAAIGRALGVAGFGTQFTEDFEDDDHLSDSPVTQPKQRESAVKEMSRETFITELGKRGIKGDDDTIKATLEDYGLLKHKGDYPRMLAELDKRLAHISETQRKVRQRPMSREDTRAVLAEEQEAFEDMLQDSL